MKFNFVTVLTSPDVRLNSNLSGICPEGAGGTPKGKDAGPKGSKCLKSWNSKIFRIFLAP